MIQNKNMNETSFISNISNLERTKVSVRALANWILDYAERLDYPVTNMSLNKLIYFAYEAWLEKKSSILTNAKIEAWDHGPVFREVYHSFKKHKDQPISSRSAFFDISSGVEEVVRYNFDEELELFLEDTLKPLIPIAASRLRAKSHEVGSAWHSVWMHDGQANPGMEITPEVILRSVGRKDLVQ